MQIHELNNFTGTLGSGAYLAIDNGTDTGKISSQGLLAATEARIDNIIAGPAPSAEEIVDARLGADGVTYPSLGDAIRDQFTDVKSDLYLSEYHLSGVWQTLADDWVIGSLNASGVLDRSVNSRCTTRDYLQFDHDIEIPVRTGVNIIVCIYNADKSLVSKTSYNSSNRVKIAKNTIFKVTAYNTTTPITDTSVFSKNVVFLNTDLAESYSVVSDYIGGYNDGKLYLKSPAVIGGLYTDGLINFSLTARATYAQYMLYDTDIRIHFESGYIGVLCTYNSDLTLIARTALYADFTVPKNTLFRLTVYSSSDSSAIADPLAVARKAYIQIVGNKLFADADFISLFESFAVIGDSLSCGYVGDGNGHAYGSNVTREAHRNWPSYLELALNRPFTNLARGSSSAHDWRYGNNSLDVHIETADIDTYCYMLAVGVNDARQSLTVGSASDIKTSVGSNADSFYGNYDWVVRKLIEYKNNRISQAKIFVFTIPPTENNAETYNVAIRYIANLYEDVCLIDLYSRFYTEFTSLPFTGTWIASHSRPFGYMMIAGMIRQGVNEYMYDNYSKFLYTPWLPLS